MQQECHRIPPKVPDGTKERGASGEEQDPAAQDAQEYEQPQLPLGTVEGEKEDGAAGQQAVDQIQRPGDPGEPQPEHPEQVVKQAQGSAQQNGLEEQQQLG